MRKLNEIINEKNISDKEFILQLEYQKIRKIKVAGATEVKVL